MNRTLSIFALVLTVGCSNKIRPVPSGNADLGAMDPMQQLEAETGYPWTVRWHSDIHTPAFLEGRTEPLAATPDDAARAGRDWVRAHASLFSMAEHDSLDTTSADTDELGMTHARLQQQVEGHPVWGGELLLHFTPDGALVRLNGRYVPVTTELGIATQTSDAARVLAVNAAHQLNPAWSADAFTTYEPKLYVYPVDAHTAKLVWRVQIDVADDSGVAVLETFLDARDGTLVHAADITNYVDGSGVGVFGDAQKLVVAANGASYILEDATRGSPATRTYSAGGKSKLPGTAVRSKDVSHWDEAPPAAGAAVDAHAYVATTWDYFAKVHGRKGWDGKNKGIHAVVHYGQGYDNAFFDGKELVFGDGDSAQFSPFAGALDVVAHEFTHGVTYHTAKLGMEGQNGALNEAVSDIFACFVTNGWKIGATIYHPNGQKQALRDVENPHASNNPATMSEYVNTADDNGGIHVNSTIVSHAAYLMARKLPHATVEKIWYRALSHYLHANADFAAAADATLSAARDVGGPAEAVVREAWMAAGVVQ